MEPLRLIGPGPCMEDFTFIGPLVVLLKFPAAALNVFRRQAAMLHPPGSPVFIAFLMPGPVHYLLHASGISGHFRGQAGKHDLRTFVGGLCIVFPYDPPHGLGVIDHGTWTQGVVAKGLFRTNGTKK